MSFPFVHARGLCGVTIDPSTTTTTRCCTRLCKWVMYFALRCTIPHRLRSVSEFYFLSFFIRLRSSKQTKKSKTGNKLLMLFAFISYRTVVTIMANAISTPRFLGMCRFIVMHIYSWISLTIDNLGFRSWNRWCKFNYFSFFDEKNENSCSFKDFLRNASIQAADS